MLIIWIYLTMITSYSFDKEVYVDNLVDYESFDKEVYLKTMITSYSFDKDVDNLKKSNYDYQLLF